MPLVKRMQHMALEVADTDRAIEFYRRVFGFKVTERHPAYEVKGIPVELTFLRLGTVHHELVLVHNPNKTYTPRATKPEDDVNGPPSFHHYALECDNAEDFAAVIDQLKAEKVPIVRGPVLHSWTNPRGDGSWGENEAVYCLDPDGHRIEIFCDLARIDTDGTHINAKGMRLEGTTVVDL